MLPTTNFGKRVQLKWCTLLIVLVGSYISISHAKSRFHIPDDLSDVVDDEEDEEWKEWGKRPEPKKPDPLDPIELGKPVDVKKMMKKQSAGPQLAFARLKTDPKRTKADVDDIGGKWTALLKTGGMADQIYAVDENTILVSIRDGIYMDDIRDFVLSRDETDHFEWNQQKMYRPGEEREPEQPKKPSKEAKEKKSKKKSKKSKKNKKSDEL
ncbi:hypothetical protein CYMTET_30044 [Cymbomonas tetramitiformis]|uniref:Mesoderm development candidate 2 n=1 Tax=Cymbomonas tetramitiformis TaxID=36881 RepID=A0AAE0KUA6_9CHLO|nr:hypothetical protein CYMTET_30044 [Cymbomonas tetramitiformis]